MKMFTSSKGRVPPVLFAFLVVAAATAVSVSVVGSVPPPYLGTIELSIDSGNAQTGTATLAGAADQDIAVTQGCNLVTGDSLLSITGNGKSPGVKSGGIGIRSKGPGEDCGEIQGAEFLNIALGSDSLLDGKAIGRAELDVEVKGDVVVVVTTSLLGGPGDVYTLNTGGNASDQDAGPFATSTTASPVAECNGGSDSRPDSRDNCRWTLDPDVPFDSFSVDVIGSGSVSLEGGADAPEGGTAAPTVFELVEAPDGILDCGDEATQGNSEIGGVITRLDNPDGSTCNLKPYQFDVNGNELLFAPQGSDVAAYSGAITGVLDDSAAPFNQWIQYDPEVDGTFVDMQWCIDSTITTTLTGGDVVRLVTAADLPSGESWCVAALDVLESDDSMVFWVYGSDDPGFRFS